jgi:hypothetical protein
MIENHRTGLVRNNFMSSPEITTMLKNLNAATANAQSNK